MKKILIGLFVIVSIFGLISCENTTAPLAPEMSLDDNTLAKKPGGETAYTCTAFGEFVGYTESGNPDYAVYEYTLWAGQHNDAGTVTITNDDDNIYVTYNTNETADLDQVHVYVWTNLEDIPSRRPAPGHADFMVEDINADAITLTIPAEISCGNTYYISTHAALVSNDTEDDESGSGDNAGETAYAGDVASPDCFDATNGSWWGYVTYTVECFYDISGTVYNDADDSSDLEDGEASFGGITVDLRDADDNVIASTTTDTDGNYTFEYIAGGADYTVVVSTDPDGDYLANENADGFPITGLNADTADVDFGYVPLWDISLNISVNADCGYDLVVTFDGIEIASIDGFYFIENQLPGVAYTLEATATSSEGSASQTWTGGLSADIVLDWDMTVECPAMITYDPCDTNEDGYVDAAEELICNPPVNNDGDCELNGSSSRNYTEIETNFQGTVGSIKFGDAQTKAGDDDGLGEDGLLETDTFTITADYQVYVLDIATKSGSVESGDAVESDTRTTVSIGDTYTDAGGYTITWNAVNFIDGQFEYTFTVTSDEYNTTAALSHISFYLGCFVQNW